MTPKNKNEPSESREIEKHLEEIKNRLKAGQLRRSEVRRRTEDLLRRTRDFNQEWDRDPEFYVEEFESWMEAIPAIWIKALPYPHPAFGPDAEKEWRKFLAEQRKISGQEAAYLTNDARGEKKILQQIVVSRIWLWVALNTDSKIGSEDFWEAVLDEVVRELPDWTIPYGDDRLPPDAKTLRNTINVGEHKRFLDRLIDVRNSRDG